MCETDIQSIQCKPVKQIVIKNIRTSAYPRTPLRAPTAIRMRTIRSTLKTKHDTLQTTDKFGYKIAITISKAHTLTPLPDSPNRAKLSSKGPCQGDDPMLLSTRNNCNISALGKPIPQTIKSVDAPARAPRRHETP